MEQESLKSPKFGALSKPQMAHVLGGGTHPVSTDGGTVTLHSTRYNYESDSFEYNEKGVLEFRSYYINGNWIDA